MLPGLLTRPICNPPVSRTIHLATVAGRRFSPAVATFIKAEQDKWGPIVLSSGARAD